MLKNKIMIVDDDPDVISVMEHILSCKGHKVLVAYNKAEAMQILEYEKPDLAILDVIMSTQYEGFELAKVFATRPELKEIPVLIQTSIDVLITTRPDVQDMAREFRNDPNFKEFQVIFIRDMITGNAGVDYVDNNGNSIWVPVDGFIPKPVDTKRLLEEVEHIFPQVQSN